MCWSLLLPDPSYQCSIVANELNNLCNLFPAGVRVRSSDCCLLHFILLTLSPGKHLSTNNSSARRSLPHKELFVRNIAPYGPVLQKLSFALKGCGMIVSTVQKTVETQDSAIVRTNAGAEGVVKQETGSYAEPPAAQKAPPKEARKLRFVGGCLCSTFGKVSYFRGGVGGLVQVTPSGKEDSLLNLRS